MDLFSKETGMVEKSWNTSVRIMFDIPLNTHCYYVEALSETKHVQTLLYGRFLGFVNQIENSQKTLPRQLLETIKNDVRSILAKMFEN